MIKKEIVNAIDNFDYKGFVLNLEDVSFKIPNLMEEEVEKTFLYQGPNQDLYFAIYPEINKYIYIYIFKKKLVILSRNLADNQEYIYTTSGILFDTKQNKFIKINRKNKEGKLLTTKPGIAVYENENEKYFNPIFVSLKNFLKKPINCVTNIYTIKKNKQKVKIYGINTSKIRKFNIITEDGIKVGKIKKKGIFSFGYIDIEQLKNTDRIHTKLGLTVDDENILFPLNLGRKKKIYNSETESIRFQMVGNNIKATIIPLSKENLLSDRLKLKIAYLLSIVSKKDKILMFEKYSKNAEESAIRVFEQMMLENNKNTYFILDKESQHFNRLKDKYKDKILEKNTFKHYYYFYKAEYAISSELPSHIFNDRILNSSLTKRCKKIKFVFLQHGIMLGKPIFNPLALGFHKKNNGFNIKKTVVCSKLEAKEFYKMGYNEEDLMFTGLATLDYAFLEDETDKIVYMPTYRYWEEAFVYSNRINETSYYKDLMDMINIFKEHNLIDKLLIVPHNKFSEYIYNYMAEYKDIILPSPTEALKKGKIFITDYSSAIYDAQFRGAYPIFYWEHKEELIKNYKATPTLDEEIASGPHVYSKEDLIKEVEFAIKNNYKLNENYKNKYLKINEFTDRENTKRICKEIRKLIEE